LSPGWTKAISIAGIALAALSVWGCGSVGIPGLSKTDAAEESYPAVATTRYARALGYMDAGDDRRAVDELEDLRERYPDYSGPLVNLGIIHGRNGRPDAAVAAFERAITICSACAIAHNQLGIAQRKQGRFMEAEKSYLRAIKADPGYKLAYFNLGVLHDLYNRKPELALRYYRLYTEHETDLDARRFVEKWILDLERRLARSQRSARVEQ